VCGMGAGAMISMVRVDPHFIWIKPSNEARETYW